MKKQKILKLLKVLRYHDDEPSVNIQKLCGVSAVIWTQRVMISSTKRSWRPVTSTVLQGRMLGPLLFSFIG